MVTANRIKCDVKDMNLAGKGRARIEWANQYWRAASDRLRRNGCLNTRTVRAEALFFLREFVADATLFRGDCRAKAGDVSVVYELNHQVEEIRRQLLSTVHGHAEA